MQIIQDAKTQLIVPTFDFKIKSNAIRFTDPCYSNDTWCKGSLPALNGTYNTRVGFFRDSYDEHSFESDISLAKLGLEVLNKIKTKDELDKFTQLSKFINDYRKNTANSFDLEHDVPEYPIELLDTKNHLVELVSKLPVYKNWYTEKAYIMQNLNQLLQMIFLKHYRIKDRDMFQLDMEIMILQQKNATDEELFQGELTSRIDKLSKNIDNMQQDYDDGHPKRTQFLHIKHESISEFTSFDSDDWQYNSKFNVGVDSGQAGFFDEEWYTNEYGGDKDDDRSMYFAICDVSDDIDALKSDKVDEYRYRHSKEKINLEYGILSLTAHCDGSAPLFFRTNEKDEVIEAVYHYDVKCEDDEEE